MPHSAPAVDTEIHTLPVVWHAPVRDPSGYADEARQFIFALDSRGVPLAARELRWNDRIARLSLDRERTLARLLIAPESPNSVHVWHILASHFQMEPSARANIGRTMFETDRLPEGWVQACNQMDAVWVPSEFNRATFAQSGVDPIKLRVVPGGIEMAPYDPSVQPMYIQGSRGYNFLSVFDWTLRKGWDVLIRAYIEEFRADEDVALIFKVHSSLGYSLSEIVGAVESFISQSLGRDVNRIPDIVFQDSVVSDIDMPSLYRAGDCYVMPTRGEGWGRPFMEAMAMGLPTIATNWSGQTEFMTRNNSLLLDYNIVDVPEPAYTETPTYRGHRWAEPDCRHLRQLMRLAFEDRSGCRDLGQRSRADLEDKFNYRRIAEIIANEVERLR
jgi:glycosyltransferase involved in cell wall biosynthesis